MNRPVCNFCYCRRFHDYAKVRGMKVTVYAAPLPGCPLGHDVFIHPADYWPVPRTSDQRDPNQGPGDWWAGWLAEIPYECCCAE